MFINMFSDIRDYENIEGFEYIYPKSEKIKVFPSGRRGITSANDPFDPESRLNTEFNNRRISGINGFSDSFIRGFDVDTGLFTFCLSGYSFSFNLEESNRSTQSQNTDLLSSFINTLGGFFTDCTNVYANIRLEETVLYSNTDEETSTDEKTIAKTWILRDQTPSDPAKTNLDVVIEDQQNNTKEYYFTGITFSNQSLQSSQSDSSAEPKQKVVSLCILEKDSTGAWALCQRSLLPNIAHGDSPDSIQIDTIYANTIKQNISTDSESVNYVSTPTLRLINNQLVFSNVDII